MRFTSLLPALLLTASAPAMALHGPAYTLLELDYLHSNLELNNDTALGNFERDESGGGFGGSVSALIGHLVLGEARYSHVDYGNDVEQQRLGAGLGLVIPLGDPEVSQWDFVPQISYERFDNDTDRDAPDGVGARISLRGRIFKYLEVQGRVGYLNIEESDGFEAGAGVALEIGKGLDLAADFNLLELGDESDSNGQLSFRDLRVGIRFRPE